MTYQTYAMFPEGSYHVTTSNDREHGADLAERVCRELGAWPMAMATLTVGEHTLRGPIYNLDDLKRRSK